MLAGSKSALSLAPAPSATHSILSTGETSQNGQSSSISQHDNTDFNKEKTKTEHIIVDAMPTGEDVNHEPAGASPVKRENAEATITDTNSTPQSVLDPQTPPFVPEASKTPPGTIDTTSDPKGESDIPPQQAEPQIPYPLQTPTSWTPYHMTPPEDTLNSPVQPYHGYGQSTSLYYDPTAPDNHPNANPSVYYDPGNPHNVSFYPQSTQSYASASPAHSAYEGYAMANTPHVIHSRSDAPSHQHTPSNASKLSNPPVYRPFQPQPQYLPNVPQFGSQMPITPSATPSNNGSQGNWASKTDSVEEKLSTREAKAIENDGQKGSPRNISEGYKDWCDRTNRTLKEESEASAYPVVLLDHLANNFNNPTFADCELYISHLSHRFEPTVVSLHSLLISQNPKLQELLQGAEVREDGKRQILLAVGDQHTTPISLKSAIKVCYGEQSSQYIGYPGELSSESETSTAWMKNALALAAAGHLLGMTGVAHRGEQIASNVLDWNNLQQALSFAMDTNIRRAWGTPTGSSSFPCNANELLLSCLYFVISNAAESINLDATAKSIPSINRLPTTSDSEAQPSKSRLSRIQFGDLHVETEAPSKEHDVLISSILLSLPFAYLKFVLDRLPLPVNRNIAETLVRERERRRLHASHRSTSTNQPISGEGPALYKEERLVEHHEEGRNWFSVECGSV
ncbi:MAG: hypothetical protein Q9170_002644 [Blastenia crenularia]